MKRALKVMTATVLFAMLFAATLAVFSEPVYTQENAVPEVRVLRIEGIITKGTTQFLKTSIDNAHADGIDVLVFELDTPGGLVDATLEIMADILNSPIPIVTYVAPRGAIAASAGTYILLSGHIAAMGPSTTIGAAMPVMQDPTTGERNPADQKTINLLASHLRSIARERNRPVDIAEKFVTENLTLDDVEAMEVGIIDEGAQDLPELLEKLHGRTILLMGQERTLNTANANISPLEMTQQQRLVNLLSNPEIAFLLFMIGFYGLFLGLNMPGTFIPETVGAIALILALFGLGMFEVNTTGIVLMLLAVGFFIAEVFTPTFGIFTLAGVVSMVIGALLLPFEPLLPAEWFVTFRRTVLGMAVVTGGFLTLVVTKVVAMRKVPAAQSKQGMLGYVGKVTESLAPEGSVKIRGEGWRAKSYSGETIEEGATVEVVDTKGMLLLVEESDKKANNNLKR